MKKDIEIAYMNASSVVFTPLEIAIQQRSIALIKQYIRLGENVDTTTISGAGCYTPLHRIMIVLEFQTSCLFFSPPDCTTEKMIVELLVNAGADIYKKGYQRLSDTYSRELVPLDMADIHLKQHMLILALCYALSTNANNDTINRLAYDTVKYMPEEEIDALIEYAKKAILIMKMKCLQNLGNY